MLAAGDVTSVAFQALGQAATVPTVIAIGGELPGLAASAHPHEPYITFQVPDGQQGMRERNPRVYGNLLQAQSRLLQIWSGCNYLGYRDDHVPPFRFAFLLERGRYFAEHARNAQRDYLNFLNNAENEEFKELSAAQNVELEKANIQVEAARVSQAAHELTAARQASDLARLHAEHAIQAYDDYLDFSAKAQESDAKSLIGSIIAGEAALAGGIASGTTAMLITGFTSLYDTFFSGGGRYDVAIAERLEKRRR